MRLLPKISCGLTPQFNDSYKSHTVHSTRAWAEPAKSKELSTAIEIAYVSGQPLWSTGRLEIDHDYDLWCFDESRRQLKLQTTSSNFRKKGCEFPLSWDPFIDEILTQTSSSPLTIEVMSSIINSRIASTRNAGNPASFPVTGSARRRRTTCALNFKPYLQSTCQRRKTGLSRIDRHLHQPLMQIFSRLKIVSYIIPKLRYITNCSSNPWHCRVVIMTLTRNILQR